MSYTDLRDFNAELALTDPETGFTVQIEKSGGGTVGKQYTGTWRYVVTDATGRELGRGQDLETRQPTTHTEAAHLAADYFADSD